MSSRSCRNYLCLLERLIYKKFVFFLYFNIFFYIFQVIFTAFGNKMRPYGDFFGKKSVNLTKKCIFFIIF